MINVERPRCRRCNAVMWAEHDPDGRGQIWKCIQCGEEMPMDQRTSVAASWEDVARAELKDLIGKVAAVDVLRQKAERIAAALKAADVPNVPELPWKTQRSGGQSRKASVQEARSGTYPRCDRCGRQFVNRWEYRGSGPSKGTPAVCADGCPAQVDVETN